MVRFGKLGMTAIAIVLHTSPAIAQSDEALLDQYILEIEQLITANDLEGARDKLNEAQTANLRDESLDMIQGQLRLLESLNDSNPAIANQIAINPDNNLDVSIQPVVAAAIDEDKRLTEIDKIAATDLLDSLRVAMENGELDKVRLFTDPTPKINSLLEAVFNNYAAVRVEVSPPVADDSSQTYLATLEFKELTTKDGDTAFPATAWKTHRLRIVKSDGSWQKVLW